MKYVLTSEFQSERIAAEFGISRQLSGGNFHISAMQVYNSLNLQKLKLFHKLDVTRDPTTCVHAAAECCIAPLTESEVELLNTCFENLVDIMETERSSLYYICGYIAHKENGLSIDRKDVQSNTASEFTKMVSQGKLAFPKEELFDLSFYLYAYYKSVENKRCTTRLLKAFEMIYDFTNYYMPSHNSVMRCFANCFGKAFSVSSSDHLRDKHNSKDIKRLCMSNKRE